MPSISFPVCCQSPLSSRHPTQYFTSCLNLSLRPSWRVQTARGEGECIHSLMSLLTSAAVSSSRSVFLFHYVSLCPFPFNSNTSIFFFIFRVKMCEIYISVNVCFAVLHLWSMQHFTLDSRCWVCVSMEGFHYFRGYIEIKKYIFIELIFLDLLGKFSNLTNTCKIEVSKTWKHK